MRAAEKDRLTLSVCLSVCLSNYGGKSHAVNPFFADVSRASRFCASVQTPRKSGLARRCPSTSSRTLRRLATPQSPDNSAPRQRGIVRYNKFTIDPSAIQGFCVNPLYLFRERVKKIRLFSPRTKHFSENLAKTPCSDCSMGRGGNTGVRSSQQAQQASTRLRILRCSGPLPEQSKLLAGISQTLMRNGGCPWRTESGTFR